MNSRTKLGIWILFIIVALVLLAKFSGVSASKTYRFDFSKGISLEASDNRLEEIVTDNLRGEEGKFAVFIENLKGDERYVLAADQAFPAASLYKLVLLAAVLKEVESGKMKTEDTVSASKAHLTEVLGEEDFGYKDSPKEIKYTLEEALTRVGRISDNFAAIMLTEKIRESKKPDPLVSMASELGMKQTSFNPPTTTASDVALFFKGLYRGEIVSKTVSERITELLGLSKINNRIPALLPEDIKVIHKTGELSRARHDGGIVYLDKEDKNASESAKLKRAYLIVMLSKDLKFEDRGVEALANISKEVWEYFRTK